MRPPSPSIPEKIFVQTALEQSLRVDGRALLEVRTPKFTFGPELGWVECSLGETKVLAVVDAKMVRPPPERPYEGLITIHSEISPMASSEFEPGRPSEEEVFITRMLDKILRRSDTVDKESLCILAGQRVWHLRLTAHFLADAGNILDCACLAGIVALRHFRRPDVEVIGEEVIVHAPTERAPIPLSLHHTPLTFTFAFFPSSPSASIPNPPQTPSNPSSSSHPPPPLTAPPTTITILDPTHLESRLAHGTLTASLTTSRELLVLQKAGGIPLEQELILGMLGVAGVRAKTLGEIVDKALKEDWEGRRASVEVR